mmetsp:Transcript_4779/g.9872  ORF Transcript_4779/g.9872 Transcript_4779/m.9872 type:complete len:534 (+) Transcript_4779:626-2227(+)
MEDRLSEQGGDGRVGLVNTSELLVHQGHKALEREVPASGGVHQAAGVVGSGPSEEHRDVAALVALLCPVRELRERRREDVDAHRGLLVARVAEAVHPRAAVLEHACGALRHGALRLHVPHEEVVGELLILQIAVDDLHPLALAAAEVMRRDLLARTPAGDHHGDVVAAVDDVLDAVELAEVGRARVRSPVHGAQLDLLHLVQHGEVVRLRRGAAASVEQLEQPAEVLQRRGQGGAGLRTLRRVDADHRGRLRSSARGREDVALLEGRRVDVQGNRDVLRARVDDPVQPQGVVHEGDALLGLRREGVRLARNLGLGTAHFVPGEALLAQLPGEHLHKAVRSCVVVDRALLPALPAEQEGDELAGGVPDDVPSVTPSAKDGVLLPLPRVELCPAEQLGDPRDHLAADRGADLRLRGQLAAELVHEARQVQEVVGRLHTAAHILHLDDLDSRGLGGGGERVEAIACLPCCMAAMQQGWQAGRASETLQAAQRCRGRSRSAAWKRSSSPEHTGGGNGPEHLWATRGPSASEAGAGHS